MNDFSPLRYRHIAVTGGAGFIGSHFIRLVLRLDPAARVTNIDKLTYAGNPANLAEVAGDPRYRFLPADIADPAIADALRADPPEAIVNFAAETHVDRSITDPQAFVRTDVLGVQNLLDLCRALRIARFVQVGTDEVYGSIAEGSVDESCPLAPRSPYAASKAGADLLCRAACITYGTPVVICRGSNTYGPHQYPEKLIPLAITNLLSGQPIPLYGDGRQRRDWLYVEDHCRGLLTALERGEPGEVYNVAGEQERENLAIIDALLGLLEQPASRIQSIADRPGHDRRYAMSGAKLRALGWAPQMPLAQGLAETVAWYCARRDWWEPLRRSTAFRAYYHRQYPTLPPLGE